MSHPDQMRFRTGGGCLMLFGAPFFFMGLLFFVQALRGEVKSEGGGTASPWMVALVAVPFMLVGAGLMLGRAGVTVDRRNGSVVTWWGALVPMRTTRRELSEFQRVSVERKVIKTQKSTSIIFPVALRGRGGEVECESGSSYEKSLRKAEELAKFTGLALEDRTTGEAVVREAAHLDESLAERSRRLGVQAAWPPEPEGSRIVCEIVDDSAVFRLPAPGFQWLRLFILIPALAFALFFITSFLVPFTRGMEDLPFFGRGFLYVFVLLFVGLPVGGTLIPAFRGMVARETVAASREGLQIQRKGLIGSSKWTFTAEELEELQPISTGAAVKRVRTERKKDGKGEVLNVNVTLTLGSRSRLSPAAGLRARSDRQMCDFGAGLTAAEIGWLAEALTHVLVQGPPR